MAYDYYQVLTNLLGDESLFEKRLSCFSSNSGSEASVIAPLHVSII